MKRFRFRLEAVLKHRMVMEDLCLQRFAVVQQEMAASEARLVALRDALTRAVHERPAKLDPIDIALRERYVDGVNARIEQELRIQSAIAVRLEETRKVLVDARRARQAIDKVREKDLEDYRREVLLTEQAALDEIATMAHARKDAVA